MSHQHTPAHTSVLDGGIRYEVCECGASRRIEPNRPAPPWHACSLCTSDADPERAAKLDAERVTLEFRTKSKRRLDAGKKEIEDSPLFGGSRQKGLFDEQKKPH